MRYLIPCLALMLPLTSFANDSADKQWFNAARYTHQDRDHGVFGKKSFNIMDLSSTYYLAPQQSTGVWDDYGYLDTDSKISVGYVDSDYDNAFSVSGEAFLNNWFMNASISDLSHEDNHSIGFGYLYNDSLKISITSFRYDNRSDDVVVGASYNHQINDSDYLGVSVSIKDNPDDWSISGRYFKKLEGGQYLALDVSHEDFAHDRGSFTRAMVSYYVNENWAFGIGAYDSDLELEAKFFFSDKYYYRANYSDDDNGDRVSISFHANF